MGHLQAQLNSTKKYTHISGTIEQEAASTTLQKSVKYEMNKFLEQLTHKARIKSIIRPLHPLLKMPVLIKGYIQSFHVKSMAQRKVIKSVALSWRSIGPNHPKLSQKI